MGSPIPLLASVVSTLGGLVFGYELGIISGALLQLKAEFRLSCVQQETLVSSLLIGALLASIMGGCLIDYHGRRNSILLSNALILTGSLVLLISSYSALVVGRITVGFAMCISSMSCCIFVSEMVTPGRRGFLVTLYEAGITVGILAAYVMNYILSDSKRGWKWMFGLAIVPTLIQLVSIWFLPSSTKGSLQQRDCFPTERDLTSAIENLEADDSKASSSLENKKVQYNSMYLFQRKDNMRTRTVIGLGLVLFQQFTGQPNVLLYASTIFHSVGFHSNASAVLASVGLGLVKVIATLTSMVFSDRVGRRPLLISGCSVMALGLITIGLLSGHSLVNAKRPCNSEDFSVNRTDLPNLTVCNWSALDTASVESRRLLKNNTPDEDVVLHKVRQGPPDTPLASSPSVHGTVVNWIILVCMMAVVSAYSVGFGPMTWLLLSEIFPAAIRGRAFAFTSCFNWAANLLVTFTFLNFIDAIGLSGMFLLYGMSAVAAGVFFYFILPETKGKTLEEIDEELCFSRLYHSKECCGIISRRNISPQYQRVHCQVTTSG
ncbi:solute carrier family 2, facilitated glucose transporter member 10 isoform X1 [Micropterus salmoides]|uniref:solute carrier family 2, facilitated glucose transporter member 10 isoform X1 n=2 Tax=Micropterus salmoides TaxID=27706 RepID=UPI0018EC5351|nr:solute carrier family 2, facilitated glucose transporter member 10 isoform X1 [Micropterus salmoides]XP_038551644.1 solute carrier family 2, facilitated glucose transporter member 10 isoform X1 [Micropterus salmoides]XP_038551645.1 solute carrier family 2, facilitated glucose transporter member 10 isoform X1 [Micropterus salmoides]XP_038551646.1 solute carrier family 2, facilitated glucose transporter member 10 isoform X1 [Micropterus salmoides]